ncbi:MAG: ferredoxin [Chloroflexi bacterium]|nr:MAG: ferredoxin [Chloroflexota bacterium]
MKTKQYHVEFEPIGRRGECPSDESLLEAAHRLGIELVSLCGGRGTCHRCKIQVLSGKASSPTASEQEHLTPEELANGYRLACQAYPLGDCTVHVPAESLTAPQRTQVEGQQVKVTPNPPVRAYNIEMSPPSLSDLRADAERMVQALNQQRGVSCRSVDTEVLRGLSPLLRSWDWKAQLSVRGAEVVAVLPPASAQLGLAIDLGTTKIAGYLVDLGSGETLAAQGIMNPQISYGEDVIARLSRVSRSPSGDTGAQKLVVEAIDRLAADLCAMIEARPENIVEAVVVGNTAMHHLLLRLPVDQLGRSPFVPAVSGPMDTKVRDVGLHLAPGAYLHTPPNIAGFVGGDHVAMLLATDMPRRNGLVLALDIGTNTEVALVRNGEIASVSCASGPAFEGAHIKDGMRAAPGAIERLRLVDNSIEYQTIGGQPPVGLCGSGILDAMAQLYLAGVLDKSGRLGDHPRVRSRAGQREFVLVSEEERDGRPAICITQGDIRELQLAKGAIRTGINVLLESTGCSEQDIEEVVIAGAFGSYIDVSSAVTVGMLPPLPLDRFHQVGNAAGTGARLVLTSMGKRSEAQAMARRIQYIELTTAPQFHDTFIKATQIG